jgi:hypothetical protein
MIFDNDTLYRFLHETDFDMAIDDNFDNRNFLYDYNEVQELYLDTAYSYNVYLTGVTGLNKTKLLHRIVSDLIKNGVSKQNIIYADFELAFIREMPFDVITEFFPKQLNRDFFLVVNEIGLKENFFAEVRKMRELYPNVRLLASCSIPFLIYEYLQDNPDDYSKIVVLSPKNESNVKSESDTFGVYNNLKYNIKNDICEIKGMTGHGKTLSKHIIPSEINGYPVKIIASGAFHHRTELNEIELPDTIEYIGDYAFTKCDNLKEIKLHKNLMYIGDCAFLGATKLKIIIGGDNVTHIGCSAFYATEWLAKQSGDFVTLGKVLYRYNGDKYKVIPPKRVSVLSSYAFRTTDITEIDLKRIGSIGEGCFYGCEKLTNVKNYTHEHIQAFMFYNCRSLHAFNDKIEVAYKYSFYNCFALEEIIFDKAEIGTGAFENCGKLITANGSIKSAGKSAFYNAAIMTADLKKVKTIGDYAFLGSQLCELQLQNVCAIGRYAFADISQLKEVYLQNCTEIKERIFQNSISIIKAKLSGKYPLSYYFGGKPPIEKLSVNGDCCDNFCRDNNILKELHILNGDIGNWAFYNNVNLIFVKLQQCTTIGAWAFAHCEQLEELTVPKSVQYIKMNAFRYCRKLSKIELQSSKPVMFGTNAFYFTAENKHFFVINKKQYLNIPIWQDYIPNMLNLLAETSNENLQNF